MDYISDLSDIEDNDWEERSPRIPRRHHSQTEEDGFIEPKHITVVDYMDYESQQLVEKYFQYIDPLEGEVVVHVQQNKQRPFLTKLLFESFTYYWTYFMLGVLVAIEGSTLPPILILMGDFGNLVLLGISIGVLDFFFWAFGLLLAIRWVSSVPLLFVTNKRLGILRKKSSMIPIMWDLQEMFGINTDEDTSTTGSITLQRYSLSSLPCFRSRSVEEPLSEELGGKASSVDGPGSSSSEKDWGKFSLSRHQGRKNATYNIWMKWNQADLLKEEFNGRITVSLPDQPQSPLKFEEKETGTLRLWIVAIIGVLGVLIFAGWLVVIAYFMGSVEAPVSQDASSVDLTSLDSYIFVMQWDAESIAYLVGLSFVVPILWIVISLVIVGLLMRKFCRPSESYIISANLMRASY